MILNTITLHNFMSYADERLDLTSVNVACLTGQNGAGKWAILDAVTWAIWEEARSSSDELIRLGQKEMWVEVGFELEGQHYRIRRARQRSVGKGGSRGMTKGNLDLQVRRPSAALISVAAAEPSPAAEPASAHLTASGTEGGAESAGLSSAGPGGDNGNGSHPGFEQDDSYSSLTGPSMKETQDRISKLLRMEYDTFINSVYLRQGKADEFTTRAPAERKKVLSEILGLSYFDLLQEKSRDRTRELKGKAEAMEMTLSGVPQLEARLAEARGELDTLSPELSEATNKVEFYDAQVGQLKDEQQALQLARQQMSTGKERSSELQSDIEQLRIRETELAGKLAELNSLLKKWPELEAAAQQFDKLKDQVQSLDHAALELQDLNTSRLELQSELAGIRSRLEVEQEHWRSRLTDFEKRQSDLSSGTADREKLEASYVRYKDLLAQESELSKRQEAFTQLVARSDELQSMVTEARIRLEAQVQQKTSSVEELQSILASASVIEEEKSALSKEAEALDKLESEFDLVEEKGLRIKADLEEAQQKIGEFKRRQKENQEKIRELHDHSDSSICPLCAAPIVDRLAVIERYRSEIKSWDAEIDELEKVKASMDTQRAALRKQYAELKSRLDGRKGLDTRIGQFNEKLSAVEKARTGLSATRQEVETLKARLDSQDFAQVERESLVAIKTEIHKLDYDPVIYSNLQSQIRMQRHVESRYHQLQKDLTELKKLEAEVPPCRTKVDELVRQLSAQDFAPDVRKQLTELEEKIKALSYDRQEHQRLRQELAILIPSSELYRDLSRARTEMPALEDSLTACRQAVEAKQEQLTNLEKDLLKSQELSARLPEISSRLEEQEAVLAEFRNRREDLSSRKAVLESRRQQCEDDLFALEKQRGELDSVRTEIEDYIYLAEAFGKKGIQAVIIENAVPEIESEANRILSRLTDNQMHVALATQHRTKAGSVVETLDLLIGDDLGTRNYELYSGGEAFKVDFAVRVALSRLLARRTGAKLETLIIDEGFGSQDETSREKMVKAINSIRGDFARILVITHIAEMKEMFPVQIAVSKASGTSRVQILS